MYGPNGASQKTTEHTDMHSCGGHLFCNQICHAYMQTSDEVFVVTASKSKKGETISRTSKYWLALRLALPSLAYHSPVEICRQQA